MLLHVVEGVVQRVQVGTEDCVDDEQPSHIGLTDTADQRARGHGDGLGKESDLKVRLHTQRQPNEHRLLLLVRAQRIAHHVRRSDNNLPDQPEGIADNMQELHQ